MVVGRKVDRDDEVNKVERYSVYQFDGSNFVVIDQVEQREICICGDYDNWEDSRERAYKIASLLNEDDTRYQTL